MNAEDFDDAKVKAERWFEQLGMAPVREAVRETVADACRAYVDHLRREGREDTANNADQRFRQIVYPDPLAKIRMTNLTRHDLHDWRGRLMDGRQPRSVNRHVAGVVAALNRAVKEGFAGDPSAWKLDRLPDATEEEGAAVFLEPHHRAALIEAAPPAAGTLMRALELTGARPKELSEATVADFEPKAGSLTLRHKKGRPARVKARAVVLSPAGVRFFADQARDKLPTAPLLTDDRGRASRVRHLRPDFVSFSTLPPKRINDLGSRFAETL